MLRPTKNCRKERLGASVLELMVVLAVLTVAASIFAQIVLSTARLRSISRERTLAANGARGCIERLRNERMEEVFELYNVSDADDPDGPGTAPGHRFAIRGLNPVDRVQDDCVVEIVFPALFVPDGGTEGYAQFEAERDGGSDREVVGVSQSLMGKWMLREDMDLADLGMPRDLNGDTVIDALDHRYDSRVLPVCVRVSWKGRYGDRSMDVYTLLTEFQPGIVRR